MTIYQTTTVWTEVRDAKTLSPRALGYFRARLRNNLHELVLTQFIKQEANDGTKRADVARRIRKRPEQITRLLGAPGNWTLDTVSDLLLAMGYELRAEAKKIDAPERRAVISQEWAMPPPTAAHNLQAGTTTKL